MDSSLRETGQKGLAYLAGTSGGYTKSKNATLRVPLLGQLRPRLPKGAMGVGVTVTALEFADLYARGEATEENMREALVQGVQAFSALNASRFVARRLTGWNVVQRWSRCTLGGACLLLVLTAYDVRSYVVKSGASGQTNEDSLAERRDLRAALVSSSALFTQMLRPTGETIVRAFVGWCMLRTAGAASARLVAGDGGYTKFCAVLAEVEGSLRGFLGIVALPLICVWTALSGIASSVGRRAGQAASAGMRLCAGACAGVASVFKRRE